MEALIPKLFIVTAEASIVLLLILIIVFIFSSKSRRKDVKAANQLIRNYNKHKEERISAIKKQLSAIAYAGNADTQAEKLYDHEKNLIKEFVTIYLKHDTYRLLDYSETINEVDDVFLKVTGSSDTDSAPAEPENKLSATEENANATILAREQAELNETHLKELSELRLKNTELNEHLFEALETITSLMTEHGKKTGQEVESNAQKILEAIIYLRDNRLDNNNPSSQAPSPDDGHDQVDDPWSIDLAENNATLDDSTAVNLGIGDELNTDLDTLDNDSANSEAAEDIQETVSETEDDPWAAALSEQAEAENQTAAETSEPASEPEIPTVNEQAETLQEQASTEAPVEEPAASDTEAEDDPWAAALAEQAASEADTEAVEQEEDPWAAALAEQEKADKS